MKWHKLGLVYAPDGRFWWNQKYAMMPTPVYLPNENRIRVFFGTTDNFTFGRTTFVDVDADTPTKIVYHHDEFLLDVGKEGTFDDSGAVPSSIISTNGQQFLYYVGFQRAQKVPYMLFSGLATSVNWKDFSRYSEAPIIDRSKTNVYSNAAPFVLYDEVDQKFQMWFWKGVQWISVKGKMYLQAEIHYAESNDGKIWSLRDTPCIAPNPATEFSVGRPYVLKSGGKYKMFYSVRHLAKLYRLAYAESDNGIDWVNKSSEIGIDVSDSGWDSEMICYPAVISVKNKTYLFYNGNNNGETGFGVAELINEQ
jgi:predicted GH43/DUF377 family glycosyl hydrolase